MFALWRKIPEMECKGLCQDECANVPVSMIESMHIERKYDIELPVALHGIGLGKALVFKHWASIRSAHSYQSIIIMGSVRSTMIALAYVELGATKPTTCTASMAVP